MKKYNSQQKSLNKKSIQETSVVIDPEKAFSLNPNFRFKKILISDNYEQPFFYDCFEIFYSYNQSNELYLISPSSDNSIRLFSIKDERIVLVLEGHKSSVIFVRHFFNPFEKKDYLISIDDKRILKVWDLLNGKEKITMDISFYKSTFSALLVFDKNNNKNIKVGESKKEWKSYVVTSTCGCTDLAEDYIKIFSMEDSFLVKLITGTNENESFYILNWLNPKNGNNYIIEFCRGKILIYLFLSDEIYAEFKTDEKFGNSWGFFSGCIIGLNDYLCSINEGGRIDIWNLLGKKHVASIQVGTYLNNIIKWSGRFVIVSDKLFNYFYVVDIYSRKVTSKIEVYKEAYIKAFRKIVHPTYGECLLTCDKSKCIKLWDTFKDITI